MPDSTPTGLVPSGVFRVRAAGVDPHRVRQQGVGPDRCNRVQRARRTDILFTASLSAFDRCSAPQPGPGQVVWRQVVLKKTRITGYGPFAGLPTEPETFRILIFSHVPVPQKNRCSVLFESKGFRELPRTGARYLRPLLRSLLCSCQGDVVSASTDGTADSTAGRPATAPVRPFLPSARSSLRFCPSMRSLNLCKTRDPAKLARA
jgi:hypothetical protein